MRAVVTGGRGFVGHHLTAHLQSLGDEVAILDRNGADAVDIVDADAVRRWIGDGPPEVVYHLAARSHVGASWNDEEAVHRVNVGGTANVLAACSAAGVARVVVVGSAEQYGRIDRVARYRYRETTPLRPVSPYARSKVAAEELALAAQRDGPLDVICVRAFNHTGPGQSPNFLVPGLATRIAAAERAGADDIVVGNLDSVRDYTDVRDVVRAYRLLADHGEPGRSTTCARGRGVTVADIARGLLALARRPLRLVVDPELVRPVDVPVLVGDATRLRDATGWTPEIPLERTLADVLDAAARRVERSDQGTWRSSQPSSVAMARGSWRRRWPAPWTSRSSASGAPASASARASSTGTSGSSIPWSTRSGRPSSCRAAATASTCATSRTQRGASGGKPGVRIMPISRAWASMCAGSRAQSRNVLGAAIVATPRTRSSDAASHTAKVPPWPKPASHTGRGHRRARRARSPPRARSSSQPAAEKSPSDVPVPRKLNVSTTKPVSRAMWSASSGYVVPTVVAPRGSSGRPWQSTSPGERPG